MTTAECGRGASIPASLKMYYVGELVGTFRANSPEDLMAKYDIHLVPNSETFQRTQP